MIFFLRWWDGGRERTDKRQGKAHKAGVMQKDVKKKKKKTTF